MTCPNLAFIAKRIIINKAPPPRILIWKNHNRLEVNRFRIINRCLLALIIPAINNYSTDVMFETSKSLRLLNP